MEKVFPLLAADLFNWALLKDPSLLMTEETEEKQGGDQKKKADTQVMSPPSPKGPDKEDEEQGKRLYVCLYVGEHSYSFHMNPMKLTLSHCNQFKDKLQSLKLETRNLTSGNLY